MVRICVRVRILGSGMWALICLNLMNNGVGSKAMVSTPSGTNKHSPLLL